MFTFDEKRFFASHPVDPCCPPPRDPHSFPEKVEHTSRMLRDTLDRLMMFEKSMKDKYDDLFSIMTQDNVTFKELMQDAYSDFVSAVRSEVNLFETNTNSVVTLFKEAINTRLEEFNQNYSQAFADYQKKLSEYLNTFEETIRDEFEAYKTDVNGIIAMHVARFDAQDAKIDDAVAYMKSNLNVSLENLLREMNDDGSLIGIIETDVFATPQYFGAVGDGVHDDTTAIQAAIDSGKPVYFPKGTYRTTAPIEIVNTGVEFNAENATINYEGNGYAFTISGLWRKTIKFGTVNATNGGCVWMNAPTANAGIAYIDLYFTKFSAHVNYSCIQAEVSAENAYINEIRIHNGQFASGKYGLAVYNDAGSTTSACRVNNWKLYNVGLEGAETGIYLCAESNRIERFLFMGLRYAVNEGTTCFLETVGKCHFLNWFGSDKILYNTENYYKLSAETARANFFGNVFSSDYSAYQSALFDYGEWFVEGRDSLSTTKTYYGSTNWDNIKTHGVYAVNTYSGTGGVNVPPIQVVGTLTVTTYGDRVTQMVVGNNGICVRNFDGGAWGVWKSIQLA